jgi:hypothetical protein
VPDHIHIGNADPQRLRRRRRRPFLEEDQVKDLKLIQAELVGTAKTGESGTVDSPAGD